MGRQYITCQCGQPTRKDGSGRCRKCYLNDPLGLYGAMEVVKKEAELAPTIPPRPNVYGSALILFDPHIPFHDPVVIQDALEAAVMLGIKKLIIPGDVMHMDTISKYIGVGKTVNVTDELVSCGKVLNALATLFDEIVCIPGNHDQRLEKMIAQMQDTKDGRRGLEMVANLLGANDINDAEDVSYRYLRHFFTSPKITWHSLPDLILNDTWLIQHPGSVSRVPPQTERAMARKFRKSVLQGHSHVWGVGFDDSGIDVCFNGGHAARDERWRYMRERPSTFPATIHGYGIVYTTPECPEGRLLPMAVHPRYFKLSELRKLMEGA